MASVRQIAERAGVSISTVSRVLNNDPAVNPDTRDRVLSAANRWGYVRTIGRRVTTYIGFAYTGRRTLMAAFDSAVLDGVARGADDCKLDVVILNIHRDKQPEETYTQFFMRKGVRGVILQPGDGVRVDRVTVDSIAALTGGQRKADVGDSCGGDHGLAGLR